MEKGYGVAAGWGCSGEGEGVTVLSVSRVLARSGYGTGAHSGSGRRADRSLGPVWETRVR